MNLVSPGVNRAPLRVGIVCPYSLDVPGGVQAHVVGLASALERLGLDEDTARRMMRQQLADNATYARQAPEYLVPRECRNGGRLDLDPTSDRFP